MIHLHINKTLNIKSIQCDLPTLIVASPQHPSLTEFSFFDLLSALTEIAIVA